MTESLSPTILPLLRELGDLKRIRSAARAGSIAERLFVDGWAELVRGTSPDEVMARVVGSAVVAARMGDLDMMALQSLGMSKEAATGTVERAFDECADRVDPGLATTLRAALHMGRPCTGETPLFVAKLARQPRAGVTAPGRPRLLLQPAENHAEHCLIVAVYAVLASPCYGANSTAVFLAAMGHHLHSADMPDSGYSGEVLLGPALDAVINHARDAGLAELRAMAPDLSSLLLGALEPIARDDTAEALAFHAGDVIDRVLEIDQHFRRSHVDMPLVLGDYGLVHDGPVKHFHDRVIAQMGLA